MSIKKGSQKWKILKIMSTQGRSRPEDFMQYLLGDMFVGYEAHAMLSELYKDGYVTARLRTEVDSQFVPTTRGHHLMKVYHITEKGVEAVANK